MITHQKTKAFKLVKRSFSNAQKLSSASAQAKNLKQSARKFKLVKGKMSSLKLASQNHRTPPPKSLPKKVPRYHQNFKELFPQDNIEELKKLKIRFKVRGQRETVYEYVTQKEFNLITEANGLGNAKPPRPRKGASEEPPNPNSLRFPAEFRKKKKKSSGKSAAKKVDSGSVSLKKKDKKSKLRKGKLRAKIREVLAADSPEFYPGYE